MALLIAGFYCSSAQVVETSVTKNSSFQNYPYTDDHTIRTTTGLLTSLNSLQAVLFGSHQDEEPFCLESAGRLAWEDQQEVALPGETYSFVKKRIINIYLLFNTQCHCSLSALNH